MHEGEARAQVDAYQAVEPEKCAGDEHDDDRAELESRIELLSRIELSDGQATGASISGPQPFPVDSRKPIQASHIESEGQEAEGDDQRNRQCESENHVRDLEEVAVADSGTEIGNVEKRCREDQ